MKDVMKTPLTPRPAETQPTAISPDGKWQIFFNHANRLRYIRTEMYYARVKGGGKLVRGKLQTDAFSSRPALQTFYKAQRARMPAWLHKAAGWSGKFFGGATI